MNIKELMNKYGLTMKDISDRFNIPYRTIQNWCANSGNNKRKCPEYVIEMMDQILRNDQ